MYNIAYMSADDGGTRIRRKLRVRRRRRKKRKKLLSPMCTQG